MEAPVDYARAAGRRVEAARLTRLMAGWRGAGPERRPLGRPGERPQGFGALAGVPTDGRSCGNGSPHAGRRQPAAVGAAAAPRAGAGRATAPAGQAQLGVGQQHQPGPAVGLLRVADARRRPAERLLAEAAGCAPGRSGGRRPATARPGRARPGRAHHSQSSLGRRVGAGSRLDLDQHQRAAHDRPRLAAAASGVVLLLGVQPRPGAHAHRPVLARPRRCARRSAPTRSPGRRRRTWPRGGAAGRPGRGVAGGGSA